MAPVTKAPGDDGRESPRDARRGDSREVRKRQTAASYLRAARLTHDAAEQESLRHRAAELLAPRHRRDGPAAGAAGDEDGKDASRGLDEAD